MRRVPRIVWFLALVLSCIGGLHYYAGRRLIVDTQLDGAAALCAWLGLWSLYAVLIANAVGQRRGWAASRVLVWPATLWLGHGFLLVMTLAASDLFFWALGTPAIAAGVVASDGEATLAPLRALGAMGLVAGVGGFGVWRALRTPAVRRVRIVLDRGHPALDGFRIVQISDLHVGPILGADFLRSVVERVCRLEPDVVAVTGDLVDGSLERLAPQVEPLRELRARHGCFFVTGNHDHYSDADPWVAHVERLGLVALRNRRVLIRHDAAELELAGVDDHRGGYRGSTEDLRAALEGRDPALPLVLLAHEPATFQAASQSGVDLQLSGHTHGGQIWPFRYLVRLATPWVAGLYRAGAAQLYVSRGTGFWGPPMRVGAPAEITLIELEVAPSAASVRESSDRE